MEKYGKTAVFPRGIGRIGEIPYGRLRPDWGLKAQYYTAFEVHQCLFYSHVAKYSILRMAFFWSLSSFCILSAEPESITKSI